ncbi:Hpt domain-containing protein [Maribacter algarum]|uniref:Hpt domain-containing protein n=1 Tax=Maribacter algarum (ex Zhang et al. 2020) TaxID=2578118 RepID=A0A5S3QGJ2_9FLAO|nr:Hpt domain-containing protein [Maribacter algarum]TMM56655.1 Hpt domain-containing protein [Maribacter algarum]
MQEYPNLKYIKELSGDDAAFEQKFITILKEEFPLEREAYHDHIEKNDFQMAAEIVHKLKHKFNILSLSNAYKLAVVYEEELRAGNTDRDDNLRTILNQIKDYLNTL